MDPIVDHFDGFGLNDATRIERDARDPNVGNGSHRYRIFRDDVAALDEHPATPLLAASIDFQHGARHEPGSNPGILDAALVAVLLDRLRGFQAGALACRENAIVITHLETALLWMHKRALTRTQQSVLGKNKAHTAPK